MINADPSLEKKWNSYLKNALNKSLTPWHKALFNVLFMLPETDTSTEKLPPPSKDIKDSIDGLIVPWYRNILR